MATLSLYQEVMNRLPKSKNILVTLDRGDIVINVISHTFERGKATPHQSAFLVKKYKLKDGSDGMDKMSFWMADKLIRLFDAMPSLNAYINVCKILPTSVELEREREKEKDRRLGEFIDKNFRGIVISMWRAGKDILKGESRRKEKTDGYVIKSKPLKASFNLKKHWKSVEAREEKIVNYLGGGKVMHLKENGLIQFFWVISKEQLEDIEKGSREFRKRLDAAVSEPYKEAEKKCSISMEIPPIVKMLKASVAIKIPEMVEKGASSVVLKSEMVHSDRTVDKESSVFKKFVRSVSDELRTGTMTLVNDSENDFHIEWRLTTSHIPFLKTLGLVKL